MKNDGGLFLLLLILLFCISGAIVSGISWHNKVMKQDPPTVRKCVFLQMISVLRQ